MKTANQILNIVANTTIAIALISVALTGNANAKSGLTIVLKLKYSKADSHPEYYDKVRLTIGKYYLTI
jgi:hypothetical protein